MEKHHIHMAQMMQNRINRIGKNEEIKYSNIQKQWNDKQMINFNYVTRENTKE